MPRPSAPVLVLALVLFGLLGFAGWGAWASWSLAGGTSMSVHGYIALAITVVGVLGLGGGLMWLAFFSARRGFDDDQEF
jgi:hypothetical protein